MEKMKKCEVIDCSAKVSRAIEARIKEIKEGYDGGDTKKFAAWVSEALAFDEEDGDEDGNWPAFESWLKTADGAVIDAVWEAWTDF
jgi:hypothetical protein